MFPFNIYLCSFFCALFLTASSLPWWRKFCIQTGLVDEPGQRKIHSRTTPLAGGLAVMTGFLFPILAGGFLLFSPFGGSGLHPGGGFIPRDVLAHGFERRAPELLAIFAGALGMLGLGLADDRCELRPSLKFLGQLLIALIVAASGVRITLFVHNALFSYAITVLWILTITNALNFLDNMNGLCAGLGAIAAWACAWSAALKGQYLVALIAFQICGALCGFLPFNFPKGSVFLGDSGSHLTGFLAAVLAILPSYYSKAHSNAWAVLSPLLILFVPLYDLAWVVFLRWRNGQPFYIGDTNHISHRLVRRGFSRSTAVLLIWLLSAAVSFIALFAFLR